MFVYLIIFDSICSSTQENLLPGCGDNKTADQPVHPHSLVNAFDIRYLESKVDSLVRCKF